MDGQKIWQRYYFEWDFLHQRNRNVKAIPQRRLLKRMMIVWPQVSSTNPGRRSDGKSNTNIAPSQNISLAVEGPLKIMNPLNIAKIVRPKCARVNKNTMRIRRT
jgi:hypothetical protein